MSGSRPKIMKIFSFFQLISAVMKKAKMFVTPWLIASTDFSISPAFAKPDIKETELTRAKVTHFRFDFRLECKNTWNASTWCLFTGLN